MTEITREEIEARFTNMKEYYSEFKKETREDFQSIWKAIDMLLFKTGIVVTICTTIVMVIFKMVEIN